MPNPPDSQRQIVTLPAPLLLPSGDQHPVRVYLATRLKSPGSRRTLRQALNTIATLLGAPDAADPALLVAWSSLRYPHTAAIAARLANAYGVERFFVVKG